MPIVWVVAKEAEEKDRQRAIDAARARDREAEARRQEMRKEAGLGGNVATAGQQTTSEKGDQQGGWFGWLGWK